MTFLTRLNDNSIIFPHPSQALDEPNGLLAIGGNLNIETLLQAYRQGIFPWFSEGDPVLWWSPAPRMVVRPGKMHVSRSLQKLVRQRKYRFTFDQAFEQVIYQCAICRPEGTWITQDMQQAYINMHRAGHAHSVEIWQDGELTGGLYGVAIGCIFFGESMFSIKPNASKLAFYHLTSSLADNGFQLVDCQMETDHLRSLGATTMERDDFLQQLQQGCHSISPESWAEHRENNNDNDT